MLLTYPKDGDMAKSKFDMSLLKPVPSGWDESQLKALDEEEEIPYTPPPEKKGWGSIVEDVSNIPGNALEYGLDIPHQASESGGQIVNKPGRALMNLLSGTGGLAKGFFNLPYEGIKYLGEKDVIPEWLKKYNEEGMRIPFTNKHIPTHVGDIGFDKLAGLDVPEAGDQFLHDLPGLYAGGKALLSIPGVKNAGKRIIAQKDYGKLKKKTGELETKHEEATGEHKAATEEYNALKNFLESQVGYESSNPHVLERKAAEAQQKLEALRGESEATPEHLRATEEPQKPETTPLSLVEPVRPELTDINQLPKTEVSGEGLQQAESLLKTNEQKAAEKEANISEHLGEGNAHRKRVAQKLNPILEARQADVGKGYDEYTNGLKDKHVTLTNPRDAKAITADIQKRLMEGDTSSKEMIKLTDELANLGKGETMPADKFVSAYRSLRTMEQKTRSSAYGKTQQEFDRLTEAADSMKKDLKMMEGIIDKGLGQDNLKELHGLNRRYATEVAPLFSNKFYQYMQANNKAPANMIEQLTNEPYVRSTNPNKVTGTQILNEIIRNDPELLQNIVGERFAHKPESLHQWDEAAHQFIQHMPELQKLRSEHFEAKQQHAQSKLDLERAKQEHQVQREQAATKDREAAERARERNAKASQEAKEQTRKKKAEVHKQNLAKEEEHKAKAKYHKIQQEMKDIEEKHAKLIDHAKKIKEKSIRKDISLKQKLDLEHEHRKIKKQLDDLEKDRTRLKRTGKVLLGVGATVAIGTPIVKKAKSMIGGR
jgi:hypothetical protein